MGTPGEKRIFWIDNGKDLAKGAYPFRSRRKLKKYIN